MIYDAVMLSCAELIEEGNEQYMRELCSDNLIKCKFECIEKNRKIFTKRRYSSQCPKQEKEW